MTGTVPPAERRRVDGSMSLLVDMAGSLDPGYAEAATRRAGSPLAATPAPGGGRTPRAVALVGAVLLSIGLVAGVAAGQLRDDAGEADQARASLVEEVRRQTALSDQLADQTAALRAQVAAVQDAALGQGGQGRAAAEALAALELATGGKPVEGPGLVVTLDDAPRADRGAEPRGGQAGEGRIFDRDLQDVVNALWAAGAEAIAINEQRLTAQTAIRAAGEAVLVDLRPLSPPYVLKAIGAVDAMEPAFVDGPTARRFNSWTSLYGLGFTVTRSDRLRLPAAGAADLRMVSAP